MAQPQQQAPQAGGATPQEPGAQLPQQPLTAEEMRQMQVMVKQAMGLLLEDATAEQIVSRSRSGDPQQVIATIVVEVLGRLYEAATQAGQNVGMVTLLVTGIQIIGTLTEMLIEAGVLQQEQAQEFIGAVSKMAVDQHNQQIQAGGGAAPPPGAGAPPQQGGA